VRKVRDDIAVSAGSACTTGSVEASHVLEAMGGNEGTWHSAIRFGLGKDTTEEEVDYTVDRIVDSVQRRRSNSQVRLTCIRVWDITFSELNQFYQSKQNGYTPVVATTRGSYPHVDKIPDHVDRLQNSTGSVLSNRPLRRLVLQREFLRRQYLRDLRSVKPTALLGCLK